VHAPVYVIKKAPAKTIQHAECLYAVGQRSFSSHVNAQTHTHGVCVCVWDVPKGYKGIYTPKTAKIGLQN